MGRGLGWSHNGSLRKPSSNRVIDHTLTGKLGGLRAVDGGFCNHMHLGGKFLGFGIRARVETVFCWGAWLENDEEVG
jgi:hypothetical protein